MGQAPLYASAPLWMEVYLSSVLIWGLFEIWVISRDLRAARGEPRDKGSLALILTAFAAGIWASFALPYMAWRWMLPFAHAPMFWSAVGLIWGGMVLRLWSILTLGRYFRTTVFLHEQHQLITRGPYRFVRNPSYTGSLITLAGVGLGQGNGYSVIAAVAGGLIAYGWRIRVEEAAMRSRFGGDYDAYARRTWSVLPPIW